MLLVLALVAASTVSSSDVANPNYSAEDLEQNTLHEMRSAIVLNQLILKQLHSTLPQQEPTCPYPYKRVLGECFYVTSKKLSWYKARDHCLGMMGDLASPDHLHALVSHTILSKGHLDMWVGARKQDNGVWRWLNNKIVNNKDWYDTLPGARPTADCLYIHAQTSVNQGPIANFPCDTAFGFACKMNSQA